MPSPHDVQIVLTDAERAELEGWRRRVLDELLLDRLAIAAAAVTERYGPARTTCATPTWAR
jgi:hypothetical protein